jgi:hypothetical protein
VCQSYLSTSDSQACVR